MNSAPTVCRGLLHLAGILCFASAVDLRAQTAPEHVLIEHIHGTLQVLAPGAADWVLTQTNQIVRPGYRLRTGPNSRVTLRLSDTSVVPFGALTEIEILPPHQPRANSGLNLLRGILSFFDREQPGRIRVITRGAVAGIEGTEFVMEVVVAPDGTERTILSLIDGRVRFENPQGFRILTNGQQAVAIPGQEPVLTAGFIVNNVLQWAFYYPAVLDLAELSLPPEAEQALAESLAAYRSGDLLAALARYPANRQPQSDAERVYYAAVLLSVGQVVQTEQILADLRIANINDRNQRLANALRTLIAAVKRDPKPSTLNPQLSTELLARSYYEQSLARGDESLNNALRLARQATLVSPKFGFAWTRVAELEFSFGRTGKALDALKRALELTPRNAQAHALQGFLFAARNDTRKALASFDRALAIDSGLANAWLGRGLTRIRRGQAKRGREDLLIAAALEPRRAVLRSYLGKAFAESGRGVPASPDLALHELTLAQEIDPNDPTAWLYSALLKEQQHRLNEAIDDLERSQHLSENRQLFRSRLLLDQDRAVRGANLARIYADAGLEEVAVREASQAVAADYGNSSAHLFLANSYELSRRANLADLRYEPVAFNEYLLATLMGPADGRLLAQPVSQQEYTRLFEQDYVGLSSSSEYLSRGSWAQYIAQYGTWQNTSYALEGDYLWDPGQRRNADLERWLFSAKFKQMLTPRDGLFIQALHFSQEHGDIAQRYDPEIVVEDRHTHQEQEPTLLAGFDHQWNEENRTLFLTSHINASLRRFDPRGSTYLLPEIFGNPVSPLVRVDLTQEYQDRLTVNSFELQHLNRISQFQTVAGIRFQDSTHRLSNRQIIGPLNASNWEGYFAPQPDTEITNQNTKVQAVRISPYLYEHWQVADSFWLIAGLSYDYQEQPRNFLSAPISDEPDYVDQLSPKGAFVWTPSADSAVRGAYTRSLGGVSLEQFLRLEPSQLGGFVQGYRDVIPTGIGAGIHGSRIETADLSIEHRFKTRTYIALAGQFLRSAADHDVGVWQRDLITSSGPGIQIQEELRYQERSLDFSAHQLVADWFSFGVRYRLSEARLKRTFPDLDAALVGDNNQRTRGLLHTVTLQHVFRHPSGFFASAEALWWSQDLGGNLSSLRGDEFWQGNFFAGYRSARRYVEVTIGVLNVTDEDYRLHPINLYADIARERTFFTRLQLNF